MSLKRPGTSKKLNSPLMKVLKTFYSLHYQPGVSGRSFHIQQQNNRSLCCPHTRVHVSMHAVQIICETQKNDLVFHFFLTAENMATVSLCCVDTVSTQSMMKLQNEAQVREYLTSHLINPVGPETQFMFHMFQIFNIFFPWKFCKILRAKKNRPILNLKAFRWAYAAHWWTIRALQASRSALFFCIKSYLK